MLDELGGPPNKPLPREPSVHTDTSVTSPNANSALITNNSHEKSTDGVTVPNESTSDGENSVQTYSPPSSPDV